MGNTTSLTRILRMFEVEMVGFKDLDNSSSRINRSDPCSLQAVHENSVYTVTHLNGILGLHPVHVQIQDAKGLRTTRKDHQPP